MAAAWKSVDLKSRLLTNVKEAVLRRGSAAAENLFYNEAGGQSRFPGLKPFVSLIGNEPTYLHEWRGDLMASTTGRLFRIDVDGNVDDVTKVQIGGGQRVIFDRSPDELLMAAGGAPVRFAGEKTDILSEDAPNGTHIGFLDAYVIVIERDSGRFQHSLAGEYRQWDPLDTFSANGKPDNINGMLITPFREILLTGIDSTEQFERLTSGSAPFYRRWAVGEGVWAPYTLTFADNATWFINKKKEFVRLSGQTTTSAGDDVGRTFEGVDDWTGAWAAEMAIVGQKFIILQIPNATNAHGTKGITALYDFRQKRWSTLYGWDPERGVPMRWPGWSYYALWGRHFVGGNGKVLELDQNVFDNDGVTQRVHMRTAHIDGWGESEVVNVRMRVKRGESTANGEEPVIRLRALRDNTYYTRWVQKGLGALGDKEMRIDFGPMGIAQLWQFQIDMTDAAEYEVVSLDAQVQGVGF